MEDGPLDETRMNTQTRIGALIGIGAVVLLGIAMLIYSGFGADRSGPSDVTEEASTDSANSPASETQDSSAGTLTTTLSEGTQPQEELGAEETASAPQEGATQTEQAAQSEEPAPVFTPPKFELVRVDKDGAAVVAGQADANVAISILGNDALLAATKSDASGAFVALLDIPKTGKPTVLKLLAQPDAQTQIASVDTYLVFALQPDQQTAPKIVADTEATIAVVQSEETMELEAPAITKLSIDSIEYGAQGEVLLGGRANSDKALRVYVDNKPSRVSVVSDGQWRLELPDIDEGVYTLRVDALDDQGQVTARAETPFKREFPNAELGPEVTVQPGFTLWELAERKYGSGTRYVQIFEANRSAIKDPNLIYPGQVFDLPEEGE